MRLPSFIRLPHNRKFKFSPRHYDPIKDDLDQRISESKNNKIKHFKKLRKSSEINTSRLQIINAFILSFFIYGWIYIVNKIFIFMVLIPLWFLYKKLSEK